MPFANREDRNAYLAKYREANREKLRKQHAEWTDNHREYKNSMAASSHRRRMRVWKTLCIEAKGGKCERCPFSDYRALQLHHANGDGKIHRADVGSNNAAYYRSILEMIKADPASINLLCANCHAIDHHGSDEEVDRKPVYFGGKRKMHRLGSHDVLSIRKSHADGESITSLAKKYSKSRTCIRSIIDRITYGNLS